MEILFMVFMVIVSIMALFAVMVVFRDIVQEILNARREAYQLRYGNPQNVAQPVEQPVEQPVPVVEVVAKVEEQPVEEEEEQPVEETPEVETEEDAAGTISFSAGQQQTLEEKYLALSAKERGWYDEIIKYASIVDGSKRFKNARYEEYKVGKNRLVRMLIKRGVIHCEFILHNADFKNYVNENKISVRQSATTMRIDSEETVAAAKNSIDIVVAFIAEEREYKKQLARERRKAAKEAAAAEAQS